MTSPYIDICAYVHGMNISQFYNLLTRLFVSHVVCMQISDMCRALSGALQLRVCRDEGCRERTGLRLHLSARSGVRHQDVLSRKKGVGRTGRKLEPSSYTSWRSEFFEQPVVLIEGYREERIKCTALTAGHFRTTCLSLPCLQHGRRVWSDPF